MHEEGLAKSVLVLATSDESPLMRRQAAYVAMAVSEYFRDLNKDVLCMMDSITRFAMAQREISLSVGFPCIPSGKWSGAMTDGFKEVVKPIPTSDLRNPLTWLWQARRDDRYRAQ